MTISRWCIRRKRCHVPAKERLENAFWELLADRDYRKITVTDVVREAGVNRNSFYYHFSSLPELADSAILHQVESIPINRTPDPNGNPEEQWRDRVTAPIQSSVSASTTWPCWQARTARLN